MQVRSIILAALSVLVLVLFLKLVFDTAGPSSPKLKDAELEKALSSYRSKQAKSSASEAQHQAVVARRKARPGVVKASQGDTAPATYSAPEPRQQEEVFQDQLAVKNQMNDANRLYDKADYEGAREAALEVLGTAPDNVRMLRIVVSSSCIMAEEEMANRYYAPLPDRDKRQMARRCKRYGIEFAESE